MSQDSDEHLIRYLLGDLPGIDAQRLDERSVVDAALAFRLGALEDDLVDRYARGEPFDGALERFHELHRSSPYLQEKVRFAQALGGVTGVGSSASRAGGLTSRARVVISALATAAALVIAASGYLLLANQRLHEEIERLRAQPATGPASPVAAAPTTVTVVLPPPRRGGDAEGMSVTVTKDIGDVVLRLQVESAEFTRCWAAVKEVVTGKTIWRSADSPLEGAGPDRVVTIILPAALLRAQRYAIELWGIGRSGSTELVSEYQIRVVLE